MARNAGRLETEPSLPAQSSQNPAEKRSRHFLTCRCAKAYSVWNSSLHERRITNPESAKRMADVRTQTSSVSAAAAIAFFLRQIAFVANRCPNVTNRCPNVAKEIAFATKAVYRPPNGDFFPARGHHFNAETHPFRAKG